MRWISAQRRPHSLAVRPAASAGNLAVVSDQLPKAIAAEIHRLPEFRMGVHRVGVRLMSGISVDDVLISGGRVTRVLGHDPISFEAAEVVAIEDQSERPLPPGV
jgi:hypothetical protein